MMISCLIQSSVDIVRPFPPSFHDHDDASMPWYDCIEEDKLCVLGLFAILAYDDDDNGDLGVEHRLVYPTEWPLFELTPQRLEALRDDLIAAGILRLDIHNEDWHFQGVGGQSAQSLKAIVMDGLIRKKCAILVFDEAVSQLSTPIFSTFTYQTYLSLLQLTWAFSQIAQDQTKKHRVVEDLLKARLRFMALLRYIQKYVCPLLLLKTNF